MLTLVRNERSILLYLFALPLTLKLLGITYMNTYLNWNLVAPDTRGSYQPLAEHLLQGHGYEVDGDYLDATRVAPLFPLYLASVYGLFRMDVPIWWLGVLNALFRAATTALVYLISKRCFGAMAGVTAALLHACDPWEMFWVAFVLKESLAVFLLTLAVWWVVRMFDSPSWQRGILAGVALGLASLTRYASLGYYPWVLGLIGWRAYRRLLAPSLGLRLAAVVTAGLLAVLAPWVVRNYSVSGEPLISSHFAGLYFYLSNGPGVEQAPDTWGYSGQTLPDPGPIAHVKRAYDRLNTREWMLFRQGLRHLIFHPDHALTIFSGRFYNMWRPTFENASYKNFLVLGMPYCALLLLALIGLALALKKRAELSVLYATLAFFLFLHLFFWSEIRYRQYITPFLAVFAGYPLGLLAQRRLCSSLGDTLA